VFDRRGHNAHPGFRRVGWPENNPTSPWNDGNGVCSSNKITCVLNGARIQEDDMARVALDLDVKADLQTLGTTGWRFAMGLVP